MFFRQNIGFQIEGPKYWVSSTWHQNIGCVSFLCATLPRQKTNGNFDGFGQQGLQWCAIVKLGTTLIDFQRNKLRDHL